MVENFFDAPSHPDVNPSHVLLSLRIDLNIGADPRKVVLILCQNNIEAEMKEYYPLGALQRNFGMVGEDSPEGIMGPSVRLVFALKVKSGPPES